MVQWLRLHTSIVGGTGLIPGGGTKNPTFYVAEKKKKSGHHTFPGPQLGLASGSVVQMLKTLPKNEAGARSEEREVWLQSGQTEGG